MQPAAGRLPAEVTELVGRQAEVADVGALLDVARLVTITGPGGVGKTRVCVRAARAAQEYDDGVCFLALSGLRDPGLLASTVASGLGLHVADGPSPLDAVLDHLRTRRLLLVLDTCEHLAEECALFAEALLRGAPRVTLLATSRRALDAPGEHAYPLLPLPVPDAGVPDPVSAGAVNSGDAVELFARRAAAAVPGFAVTSENRGDVLTLCRRLDGMPLAIELAAPALRVVPLPELAGRYDQVLRTRRGRDLRHRSLDAAIEWSYDLCSPAERALWRRLSVFAGDFGVEGAQEVCAGDELAADDVFPALISLVDQSVVLRAGPGGRFRLLDTIREFGAGKLGRSGEAARFRGRHLARYLRMARYFGEHFLADDQLRRYRELRAEHPDISAALEYALGAPPGAPSGAPSGAPPGDGEPASGRLARDGVALATALYGYWQISSPKEGKYWLGRALDRLPDPSPQRGRVLVTRCYLGALQAAAGDAIADGREGIALAEQAGDDLTAARGYLHLMCAQVMGGAYADAAASGAEAGGRLEALGDTTGLLILDTNFAMLAQFSFDIDGAVRHAGDGLRRFGADSRELWLHGYLHNIAAMGHFLRPGGDDDSVVATILALRARHELGDTLGTAICLEGLACLASRAGRHERVGWLHGAAGALWERAGGRMTSAPVLGELHQQAAAPAREGIGGERYDELRAAGAAADLDLAVACAIADEDHLTTPHPAGSAAPPDRETEPLTRREREVAALAASGLSSREIADKLVISPRTVETHLGHVYGKLDISSRAELAQSLTSCP